MLKNKKIIIFILLFILILFVLAYFLYKLVFLKNVVVGPKWVNQAQFAGLFTAKEKGFYRNKGLDVSFKEFDFETSQIDNLLNNKVDFALVSAEEFLLAKDQGKEITAIAAFYQTSPLVVISLEESQIKTSADFEGKVLGNKGGKVEEDLIYELLLSSVGLKESDATIKKVGFDRHEVDDLRKGIVDAIDLYRTDQLYFFKKENIKYNLIYPERYGINIFNDVLIVKSELIKSNPLLIEDFVKASIEGWEDAIKNPDNAVKNTLKYVTVESYKDYDYEMFILTESIPLIKMGSYKNIGTMYYSDWIKLYEQMKSRNLIKGDFKVEDIFTNDFI